MAVTLRPCPHNISYASNACRQSLEDCLTITSLIKDEWAENRLAEFNLWAAGVGASAVKQRNSLDKRLAVETDVRDVVTNLLITLKAFIEECKKLGLQQDDCGEVIEFDRGRNPGTETIPAEEPIQRSFSPWSDSSVSDSEIEKEDPIPPSNVLLTQAMKSTEAILDQLARLAIAIRRSGTSSRLQKADRLFDSAHHEDLQNHLVLILSAKPSEIEKKRQEIWDFNAKDISMNFDVDITQLSTAQQHLINANLRRRNRFIYAQRHARKLASIQHFSTQDPVLKLETVNQPNRGPNIVLAGSKAWPSSPETKLVSAASPLSTTRSEATQITDTTVSAVATSVRFNISAPSTVMSHLSSTGSKARYPNPPQLKNLNSFKCPCCCLTLPVTFSEHDRWRKHIAQDLCPYTCYLNDCPRREVLYITRESWMNHIEKEHPCPSYWECFACDTAEKFDTAEMFIAHVKEHQSISESHLPTLIDVCLRKTPHITSCPLCHWAEDQVEDLDSKALFDHVAEHIHSFSLLSLPWAEAVDGNEKARLDSSVEKVRDWFATNFPTMVVEEEHEPSVDVTFNTWNDDNYFKQNDYFAGSSQRSGVSQNGSHSLEGIAKWTLGLGSSSGSKSESIIESQFESLCDQEEFSRDIASRALDRKENAWGSDIVALFTLVVKLYNDVYVPAREAPKTRRELIKELAVLKDVLSTLADDTMSKIFQQRLGESRKHTLNHCLLGCKDTLVKLEKLVEKHRNPRGLWGWVKWVGTMGEVAELKSKIAVYSALLSLCLSSIGNSTLIRLESSLDMALSRIPKVPSDAEDEADILIPISPTTSEPKDPEGDRKSADVAGIAGKEQSPDELVAEVIKKLREKEAFHRPLRYDRPRIKNHQPNKVLSEVFEKHVDDELKRHSLNTFTTRKWLRISTWWLLKAKHARQECERSEIDASLSISFDGKSLANQAYVDFLKASWILDKHILKEDPNLHSLQIDENRKLAQDLIDAISDESSLYKPIDTPEKADLLEQNHYIIDEEQFRSDDISTTWMDEGRWITVEKDDAGEEDEKVMFRTFVNAAIGSKKHRIKSKGAPYMLLLYTKIGECEIQVTMSSQSGSCGLNLSFTNEDLQKCDGTTSSSSHQSTLPETIELNFNGVKTEITFTNERDLEEFVRIPRTYFQAVRRREPQQLAEATETVIFQRSVIFFQQLRASTSRPLASEQEFESCELRVLETTPKQAWETVRRIVISSFAGAKKHWCKEFFLPLSGVQMKRESDNHAMVKWSDCTYEKISMDGNYNRVYSYIYKETAPNIALSLYFRDLGDANAFETTILRLHSTPIFSWPSTISPTHFIHTVYDTGENAMAYRAILIVRTRSGWRHSALLYVYRDTDFQYARAATQFRLQFHQAYYTHYVSNHFGHTFLPKEPPHFKECEKRLCHEKFDSLDDGLIEFDDEIDCSRFLSSLSSGHRMIFSRQASFISTRRPSRIRFGAITSNKGPADVHLWQRGDSVRLLTRWLHGVEDMWISMTVPPHGMDRQGGNHRASLPMVDYQRGRKVNMSKMEATDPSNRADGKKSGPIIIGFGTAKDEHDFFQALKSVLNPVLNPFAGEQDSSRSYNSPESDLI